MNQLKKKYAASIMGLVIGDALGVPVEFVSRDELKGYNETLWDEGVGT